MKQRAVDFSLISFMTLGVVSLMIAGIPHTTASGSVLTSTPPPIPTLIPAGTSNAVWTPVERDFDGVSMVLVPAGCFMMGSTEAQIDDAFKLAQQAFGSDAKREWFEDEEPAHKVCFDQPFWIDRTEVTQAQFRQLGGNAERQSHFTGDNRPVEQITWFESQDFCALRDARLPTEAEWEYAARGPQGLNFPWGNTFGGEYLNYCDANCDYYRMDKQVNDGYQYTAPAGSYLSSASWVGALDMSGNVLEWTSSLYRPYPYRLDDGRESMSDKNSRIFRGGSWNGIAGSVRAAVRNRDIPNIWFSSLGFRCARSFDSEAPPTAPTSTPAAVASTPIPAGTSNDVWMPIRRDFDGVTMVLVPPGWFMMGSTEEQIDYAFELAKESYGNDAKREWFGNERPTHEICFEQPFWIDRTEVTQAQFKQFGGKAATASSFTGDNRPVEQITWFEARDFCAVRGARLPTEAEWEYAARGPEGLTYPWGNTFDGTRLSYCDANCEYDWKDKQNNDGYKNTAPVGSYLGGVSWEGALDMSGNVWEWVSSLYQPYPHKTDDGRESTLDTNSDRVLRGGGWFDFVSLLRAANRVRNSPDSGLNFIGFRCARSY